MSRQRVTRSPIGITTPEASNNDVKILPVWNPLLGSRRLDFSFLDYFKNGRDLVRVLIEWQSGMRKGYSVSLVVRRYLQFVVDRKMQLSALSLLAYRAHLELDSSLGGTTRRGYYSTASSYLQFLMKKEVVIEDSKLPPGLAGVRNAPKATFVEKASNWGGIRDMKEFIEWKEHASMCSGLDATNCEVLAVCEGWMDLLERHASSVAMKQIDDWQYAISIISENLGSSFEDQWEQCRSLRSAIGLLYEKFGYLIPPTSNWPAGLADFCKYRGWNPDRMKAAFFPTVKSLDAFFVLALANKRLAPNVDSVIYYAFAGCVTDTVDSNMVRVRFGKFRGEAPDSVIDKKSILPYALRRLEAVVMAALGDVKDLHDLKKDGGFPIFLHYDGKNGRKGVRCVDPGMAAYMAKRFIRNAAHVYPVLGPIVDKVTGENFRTTHLLCSRLRGKSIFEIQAVAKHKNTKTTAKYLDRVEVDASTNQRHRDFQTYLLNESRAHALRRLGNGFHCEQPVQGRQECLRIDSCGVGTSGCNARRVVLESPEIVAEWIAWSAHIRKHESYLKEHRSVRWNTIWAPRLVEYEVLLETVSLGARREALLHVSKVDLLPLE